MRLVVLCWLVLCSFGAAAQAQFAATVAGSATVPDAAARGFSDINLRYDGTYWVLPSGGSTLLRHVYVDWRTGFARILGSETLQTPVRAMQVFASSAWFADQRGAIVETDLNGRVLRSYAGPGGVFGGVAASADARRLYAALERAELDDAGQESARVLEFDLAARRWTGRVLRYVLEAKGNTIGDVRFVDSRTALVVERGERFRRIYRVLLEGEAMTKVAFIDLQGASLGSVEGLDIVDPGYLVLSSADRRELVLLRAPDLVFPAFERSRP